MLEIISTGRLANTRRRQAFATMRRNSPLFNISHESANLAAEYDSTVTDSGDLAVNLSAGLRNDVPIARQFTAADSETLTLSDNSTINRAGKSWSVSGWFKPDTVSGALTIVGQYDITGNKRAWRVFVNSGGNLSLTATPDGTGASLVNAVDTGLAIEPDKWYFFAGWYDAGADLLTIQVNERTPVSQSVSSVFNADGDFVIGSRMTGSTPADEWNGAISRILISDRVWTSGEITTLYGSGVGLWYDDLSDSFKVDLISFWELNEKSGNANDRHGGQHLTDTNTVTFIRGAIAPELVTNGNFADWTSDDPDGWNVFNESATDPECSEVGTGEGHGGVGTGLCNLFSTGTSPAIVIAQALTTEIGKTYQLTFEIDTLTGGSLRVKHDTGVDFNEVFLNSGSKTIIFQATGTSTVIQFRANGAAATNDITMDNVSVKEVTGATYGLQCRVDDTTTIYGQKTLTPPSGNFLRWRFYLDPSRLTMANLDLFDLLQVRVTTGVMVSYIAQVQLKYESGSFNLIVRTKDDSNVPVASSNAALTAGSHHVECLLTRASTNVASDGSIKMWIDGTLSKTISGMDNFDGWLDIVAIRLGATEGIDAGTRGHLFLDELVVRDDAYRIGA